MASLGEQMMLMIKYHKCAPPYEKVAFISLKLASYDMIVQLRESDEYYLVHLYEKKNSGSKQ